MFFHTCIVSFCAVRAPTDFAIACTIFCMLLRITMVFGFYCNKKSIYITASIFEIFLNFMLLLIAMGYSSFKN
jgi:hypothetical protein